MQMTRSEIDTRTLFINPELSNKNGLCPGLKLGISQSCLLFVSLSRSAVSHNWSSDLESTLLKSVFVSFCAFVTNMMLLCVREESPSLVASVDDAENIVQGLVTVPRTIIDVGAIDDDIRQPGRDEKARSVLEQRTALLKSAGKESDRRLTSSNLRGE